MRTVKLTKESTKDILENLLKRSPNNYGKFESTVAQILDKVKNEMIEELLRWDISTHDPLPIPRQRYRFRRNEHNYLFH